MAKYKYSISNGFANCTIEDEIEFDDSFLKQFSEEERNDYIHNEIRDEVFSRIDWNFDEICDSCGEALAPFNHQASCTCGKSRK